MLNVSHHKLICYCWNFEILHNIYFDFFFNIQNWERQQGRDSCLKMNRYYVVFQKFNNSTQPTQPMMRCIQHKSDQVKGLSMNDIGNFNQLLTPPLVPIADVVYGYPLRGNLDIFWRGRNAEVTKIAKFRFSK
jgi:hypothetical protein